MGIPTAIRKLYVTNFGVQGSVSVIDTNTDMVVATVPVGSAPVNVSISADGADAYVTNAGSSNVSVIDTGTNQVITTVTVGTNPVNAAAF